MVVTRDTCMGQILVKLGIRLGDIFGIIHQNFGPKNGIIEQKNIPCYNPDKSKNWIFLKNAAKYLKVNLCLLDRDLDKERNQKLIYHKEETIRKSEQWTYLNVFPFWQR